MKSLAERAADAAAAVGGHVDTGAFPGAVFLLRHAGNTVHHSASGFASRLADADHPMLPDTVFDTASLTKPLVTALAALMLHQAGDLSIDASLALLFPHCPAEKKRITILDLLTHRSGIRGWYPLYCEGNSLASYVQSILSLPLASPIGTRAEYSCLNYILLNAILDQAAGGSLRAFATVRIFKPLHLESTALGSSPAPLEQTAATERGNQIEREKASEFDCSIPKDDKLVHGITHDLNSRMIQGCAGNAGLFSTAREAAILAEQFGPASLLLDRNIRQIARTNFTPFGPQFRAIGWMRGDSPDSSSGGAFSAGALGHTGFTGCSLWTDPETELTVSLFTNRIHPQPSPVNIQPIRRQIHRILSGARSTEFDREEEL